MCIVLVDEIPIAGMALSAVSHFAKDMWSIDPFVNIIEFSILRSGAPFSGNAFSCLGKTEKLKNDSESRRGV